MQKLLAITTLAAFLYLAHYSLDRETSYTQAQVDAVSNLIAPVKHKMTTQEKRAALIQLGWAE